MSALPTEGKDRKAIPLVTGVLDYFQAALIEVAKVSKAGNDQHNPGQPLHWAREKSTDHADCIGRHLSERGTFDTDNMRHSAKLAWRALALLQQECEDAGAPPSRASRFPENSKTPMADEAIRLAKAGIYEPGPLELATRSVPQADGADKDHNHYSPGDDGVCRCHDCVCPS